MTLKIDHLTYAQLSALKAKIEDRQRTARKEHIRAVREKIDAILAKEGLTVEEVYKLSLIMRARKGQVRYVNPKNRTETWSGFGKQPRWVRDYIAMGGELHDLAV